MAAYCGSGRYWVKHCKSHGGHNRKNIEIVNRVWFEIESDAQSWLDLLLADHPEYCNGGPGKPWANLMLETTLDNSFAGKNGYELNRRRVENGTHNLAGKSGSQLNRKRLENGTHHLAGKSGSELQLRRIESGTHNFSSEFHRQNALNRIEKGTHNFAGETGSAMSRKNHAAVAPLRQSIKSLRKQCDKFGIKYTGCKGTRTAEFLQAYIRDLEQKLFDHAHQIEASPCDNGDWRDYLCGWFSGVGDSARFSSANL
jgi:hypothetical protein